MPRVYPKREIYLAILVDRKSRGLMLMGSRHGGMDIEAVAKDDPNSILSLGVDEEEKFLSFSEKLGFQGSKKMEFVKICKNMVNLVRERDITMLEINPFIENSVGQLQCLDAKINFDENAEFRQQDIFALRDTTQEDPKEVRASEAKLNYIDLDGQIGCLVNGAGLAMATMDIIKMHGGEPANFLDVGGSATSEQVEEAMLILTSDTSVKAILINIFGGIMRCDVIAQGIVRAASKASRQVPIVVRLLGTNMGEAKEIVRASGLKVFACDDFEEAARKAVLLCGIMDLAGQARVKIHFDQ